MLLVVWHHHEFLLGLVLKILMRGAGIHHTSRWVASRSSKRRRCTAGHEWQTCSTTFTTAHQASSRPTGIPWLKAHPDLDAPGWFGTANLTEGYEQSPLLGAERDELDIGHPEDDAPTANADATARKGTDDAAVVVLRSAAAGTARRRNLFVLYSEENRLLPRVVAAHVQLEAFVPVGADPAGVVDAGLVPGLAVGDGQVRSRRRRQVDVRQGFRPDNVQPEDALGRKLHLADGRADADGRQSREGVDGTRHPRRAGAGGISAAGADASNACGSSASSSGSGRATSSTLLMLLMRMRMVHGLLDDRFSGVGIL